MPWCEECARYLTPSAMREDGACPSCGAIPPTTSISGRVTADNLDLKKLAAGADGDARAPWHFKLLMLLLLMYLGWRIVDLII